MAKNKTSKIWEDIDDQRPTKINITEWKRSYEGVKCALAHVGYEIVTTKEEFQNILIPSNERQKFYMNRKIIVSRHGIVSNQCYIRDILNKTKSLKTPEEQTQSRQLIVDNCKKRLQKGECCSHNVEVNASEKLAKILDISKYLQRIKLLESRRGDVAYGILNQNSNQTLFVADQEKSATVTKDGQLSFNHHNRNITVQGMIDILVHGMSLTLIGKNQNNDPSVIWLFYGCSAINILSKFPSSLTFAPRLRLKRKSQNPFSIAINQNLFRFDIENNSDDIRRLLKRKINIVNKGSNFTIDF